MIAHVAPLSRSLPLAVLYLNAPSPNAIMPHSMNNGGDDDKLLLLDHFVNHVVGKSLRITPTNVLGWVTAAMQQRIHFKSTEHG